MGEGYVNILLLLALFLLGRLDRRLYARVSCEYREIRLRIEVRNLAPLSRQSLPPHRLVGPSSPERQRME